MARKVCGPGSALLREALMLEGRQARGARGAVAAWPPAAARIGAQMLARGGNAMDAAAAASLACSILMPSKCGIGGYVLAAVVLEGGTGRVYSLDANAVAPAAARADLYEILPVRRQGAGINEREYGCSVRGDANIYGPLAVAVPGQMAGMGLLWERWGRLGWEEIVAPCQALLEDGFAYGEVLAREIASVEEIIRRFPASAAHLLPAGRLPAPDDIWHRPDMEKTLARLAAAGWRDFYEGELGRAIADAVQAAGGLLCRRDMASFAPRLGEPYAIQYRHARIYGPILPNGCLSALQMLNMLACLEETDDGEAMYWHRLAEVAKRAWRDRLRYVGDPDFAEVPVARLLSADYAAGRVEHLRQFPEHVDQLQLGLSSRTVDETLHLSTADAAGNVVAATITQGGTLGSCFAVPGTGIVLGHGMCRFDPRPGGANAVAAGKRPLNNVAPMIVRLPERDVGTGLPGGRRIICAAAQLAQRLVDFGASPLAAATAPRLHVVVQEPVELQRTAGAKVAAGLEQMGHRLQIVERVGGHAHIAECDGDRKETRAAGGGWAAGV